MYFGQTTTVNITRDLSCIYFYICKYMSYKKKFKEKLS